ncbi:hypothetical protein SSS_10594 [Sarcoptes scabiei]|nr:hypothetical protein SSS_10594 [Sarcoptes scabiei]
MEHSKAPSDWIESDLNENFREISSKFNQSNLRSSNDSAKNEYGMKPPTSKTIDDYRFSRDSKSNLPNYHDDLSNKNIDDMLFKTIGTPNSINNETNIDGHSTLGKRHSDAETIIRTKEPKSLIRNIKKRFSFNRRAKSVERQLQNRQSSISNGGDWDRNERARSVPGSREPSMPKETINQARRDESFGNLSQASVKTFTHEDSLLILECYDKNGAIKHYVISNESLPKKLKKLKTKKSVKLHLYKDHIFIAKHIASSKLCQICGKKFSLGLGKQAYQCRDCGLHCHKPCHVNVETRCFETSIGTLNLELLDNDQIFNGLIDSSGLTETIDRKLSQNNQTATIPELKITDTEDIVDGESHLITSPS